MASRPIEPSPWRRAFPSELSKVLDDKAPITLSLALFAALGSCAQAKDWPERILSGTTHESACAPRQWQALETRLRELAGKRNPAELVLLIRTFFCSQGHDALRILRRHLARRVEVISEATGETSVTRSWKSFRAYKPMSGEVWDADPSADGEFVSVQYHPDEACISSQLLRFRQDQWQIFQTEEACD